MSIPFSAVENKNGIIQLIEKELGFDYGHISGNATRMKEWTAEINLTHDEMIAMAIKAGGTWQYDDSNHEDDFPFIRTNLISGQRSYLFTTDEQGNIILDIYKVMVADRTGYFRELDPVDMQTRRADVGTLIDGQSSSGVPTRYDKTGNGILLDLIPNYNMRLVEEGIAGLQVFINREGSKFLVTDTTKKPGVDGRLHEYYVVKPCFKYALRKNLKTAKGFQLRVNGFEALTADIYGVRHRDEPRRMVASVTDSK